MSWNSYINQLTTKTTTHGDITNCNEKAAIVGLDGGIWANTPNFGLYGYPVDVPTEDGLSTTSVEINEVDLFVYVLSHDGSSNSPAGIRIANEKYFNVSNGAPPGVLYLKKNGGGACVAKCNTCAVFASWDGAQLTEGSHAAPQNPGLCNELVEKLAEYLKSNGY